MLADWQLYQLHVESRISTKGWYEMLIANRDTNNIRSLLPRLSLMQYDGYLCTISADDYWSVFVRPSRLVGTSRSTTLFVSGYMIPKGWWSRASLVLVWCRSVQLSPRRETIVLVLAISPQPRGLYEIETTGHAKIFDMGTSAFASGLFCYRYCSLGGQVAWITWGCLR